MPPEHGHNEDIESKVDGDNENVDIFYMVSLSPQSQCSELNPTPQMHLCYNNIGCISLAFLKWLANVCM